MDGITDSMDMNLRKLWETVKDREVWHTAVHGIYRVGHDLVTEYTCILQRYLTHSGAARGSAAQTQYIPSDER